MTRVDRDETKYDLAVSAWNHLSAKQRQERRAECREQGQHDWHRLPGTGGVHVCLWCLRYHETEERRSA